MSGLQGKCWAEFGRSVYRKCFDGEGGGSRGRRFAPLWLAILILIPTVSCHAAPTRQEVDASFWEGDRLRSLGTLAGYQKAIPLFLSAAKGYHDLRAGKDEAVALSNAGEIYFRIGQPKDALAVF